MSTSSDNRRRVGAIAAYMDADGNVFAASGDAEALFVKAAVSNADIVKLNPAQGPEVPVFRALSAAGQIVEIWAVDLRDPATDPPTIYLQIFDSVAAPTTGVTEPFVTAQPLCPTGAYDWSTGNLVVENGLWVALSSTALLYTAIAASQEFSITARVL